MAELADALDLGSSD